MRKTRYLKGASQHFFLTWVKIFICRQKAQKIEVLSCIWVKLDFGGPHGRQNVKMMKFWQTLAKPPNFDLFSNTAKTVDNYPFLTSIPNSWMLGENLFFLEPKNWFEDFRKYLISQIEIFAFFWNSISLLVFKLSFRARDLLFVLSDAQNMSINRSRGRVFIFTFLVMFEGGLTSSFTVRNENL